MFHVISLATSNFLLLLLILMTKLTILNNENSTCLFNHFIINIIFNNNFNRKK
jgi:hypothetical protein